MRRISQLATVAFAAAALAFVPASASAQISASIGAGVASGFGDFGDAVDPGFTVRGQLGLSALVAGVHAQVGYTRFPIAENGVLDLGGDENVNIYHYGVGGRVGMGLLSVGATAAYFSGDSSDDFGILPELSVGLGPIEAVLDAKITGDQKWWSLRGALKF